MKENIHLMKTIWVGRAVQVSGTVQCCQMPTKMSLSSQISPVPGPRRDAGAKKELSHQGTISSLYGFSDCHFVFSIIITREQAATLSKPAQLCLKSSSNHFLQTYERGITITQAYTTEPVKTC